MMSRPAPEHIEALRSAVEVLVGDKGWSAPAVNPRWARLMARAYVWAVYAGGDPLEAIARASFGGDTVERQRARGVGVFREWLNAEAHGFARDVARFESLRLIIPRAQPSRAAA